MDKHLVVEKIIENIELAAHNESNEVIKEEILSEKEFFEELDMDTQDSVQLGCVATLSLNGNKAKYFISPTASGNLLKVKDNVIVVVSVFSPLGASVLGSQKGDKITVNHGGTLREYVVEEIF